LDRGTADTLIIISIQITDEIHKRLKNARIPVVLVGTRHPEYDYLDVDNYLGGFIAGEHLVKQGYKRMGVVRASRNARVAEHREKGFRDALMKSGITLEDKYCLSGKSEKHAGFTEEAGFEVAKEYLAMDEIPEAVFCLNDTQAIGAMSAFSQAGLNVPNDVALIGYDNIKFSRYIGLSTIDQQMYNVGALATEKLNIRLNNSSAPLAQEVFSPKLVVRQTTEQV
jgi:LacI family transcriptional regulator